MSFIFHDIDEIDFEALYQAELMDAPIGAGGFVKDVCYDRAIEKYNKLKEEKYEEREQGFI